MSQNQGKIVNRQCLYRHETQTWSNVAKRDFKFYITGPIFVVIQGTNSKILSTRIFEQQMSYLNVCLVTKLES